MIFSFIRLQCNQSDFEDFLMHKFSCRHCFVCLWVNAGLQSLASCCCFHFYERWVIQCCLLKQTWQSSHWSLLFSWMKYCTIWTLHHVRECDNTGLVLLIFECENTNTTCDSLLVVEQLFWTDFIGIVSRDRCKGLINICVRFGFSPIWVLSPLLFCRTVCFSLPAFVHSFCLFFLFLFFFNPVYFYLGLHPPGDSASVYWLFVRNCFSIVCFLWITTASCSQHLCSLSSLSVWMLGWSLRLSVQLLSSFPSFVVEVLTALDHDWELHDVWYIYPNKSQLNLNYLTYAT